MVDHSNNACDTFILNFQIQEMIEFIVILLFIAINALVDDWLFNNKHYDDGNHPERFIIRACIIIALGIFVFDWKFIIATGLIFTAIFDYLLNYLRGLPLVHLGSNWIDRFYYRLGNMPTLILKSSFFIVGCVLLIFL